MSANWKTRRLGKLTKNFDSDRIPVSKSNRKEGPYPYYGPSGITDHVDDYIFDGEYLLIAEDGENLRSRDYPIAFMVDGRFWANNHVHVVQGNKNSDVRFLMYSLRQTNIDGYITGSAQPKLSQTNLNDISIETPPLPVQRRIADILGALDDKIELNRRMNETLEEMAQALYRHWFVDFGPFQDREFKDTEDLGPIPVGWEVVPLETIVNIELDNIDPQDHPEEEFDYYSFSAYDEDQYPETEVGGKIGSRKSLVKRRKVMVSRLNPGDYRIWTVYPDGERRGITSTEFIHFVPVRESLWGYLNCHLRSESFKAEFRRHASGTTGSRQRVRRRTPNEFKTAIPPETVLNEFGEKVNPIWDLIHSNRKENQQLSETRDYLLPKLISGEIEVDAAEKAVETNV